MPCCLCVVFPYPRRQSAPMQLCQADGSSRRGDYGLPGLLLPPLALEALLVAGLLVAVAVVLMVCLIHPWLSLPK
jgi:hypothetical protein